MTSSIPDLPPLILSAGINSTGYSAGSWNSPGRSWNRFLDYSHYRNAAEIAHDGGLDALFLSDHPALQRDNTSRPIHTFDPIVLFASLAAAVPDIGFFLTASTSYNSPYNLARRLASLDHISGGRVVWNAVTSFNPDVASNFGSDPLPEREERYRRGTEFIDVVKKLWRSWDADAEGFPDAGTLWDDTTARRIDHRGEFFSVQGPLNVPIGPQGYPLVAQAGGSVQGIDLAGRHADLVYAPLLSIPAARTFTAEVRAQALAHGRSAGEVKFVPGLVPIIAATRAEARRKHERLNGHDGEASLVAAVVKRLAPALDGLSAHDIVPPERLDPVPGQRGPIGFARSFRDVAAAAPTTLRELARTAEGGHRLVVGTPEDIAADITEWWKSGTVDGFTLQFPVLPDDLQLFVDEVIPLLVRAGVRRPGYVPGTLRDKFGFGYPVERIKSA
ncbi:NtaA/DmoA family FMN-dependent monooxygenase [Rhodococcoides yunnanense]|uniref:NtaA/DmoA family FMN-dependent monooxygenase n=1 Tax=Rhodococcoides yunnanense TaxID=278209 RepID=UPI000B0128D4|nr:NtaA/DmoA family FMN-dependent monooxygenase [Rhodococcus yunnanensis]